MNQNFTKKDLRTGDIVEQRNGDLGVVIKDHEFILYQAGGLDELAIFTEDLFVDGTDRSGDIFKVYRAFDEPMGFDHRFEGSVVFSRRNTQKVRKRAQELNDRHDPVAGKFRAIILEPHYRRCHLTYLNPNERHEVRTVNNQKTGQMIDDIDIALSEAPSMTVCGQLKVARTLVPVPETENVFFIYNEFQETWHLQNEKEHQEMSRKWRMNHSSATSTKELKEIDIPSIVDIPEHKISICSRCLIVRMNASGELDDLRPEDYEAAKKYINGMEPDSNILIG